jgi:hypothetical protein
VTAAQFPADGHGNPRFGAKLLALTAGRQRRLHSGRPRARRLAQEHDVSVRRAVAVSADRGAVPHRGTHDPSSSCMCGSAAAFAGNAASTPDPQTALTDANGCGCDGGVCRSGCPQFRKAGRGAVLPHRPTAGRAASLARGELPGQWGAALVSRREAYGARRCSLEQQSSRSRSGTVCLTATSRPESGRARCVWELRAARGV